MSIPSQRKYDGMHSKNVDEIIERILAIYSETTTKIVNASIAGKLNKSGSYYFRNQSSINNKVNKLLKEMNNLIFSTISIGSQEEWELAVTKNNALADWVAGDSINNLPNKYNTLFLASNAAARSAFILRKENGLGLSDRVWRNTQQFKQELELALELNIGRGKSAQAIARDVKQYLNNPDKLFRRIRKEPGGALRLSKAAKAYHPGQGIYRSSYKNALRLAANETNFSYEYSNFLKREQQPFVVGVRIKVSPRHTPSDDKGGISCFDLQGDYPKDFDWTYKWHVNCRCMSLSILKTREELDKDMDLMLDGKDPNTKSKNEVTKMPNNYNNYVGENQHKWENWKNQPRFLKGSPKVTKPKENPLFKKVTTTYDGKTLYRGDIKDKGSVFTNKASMKDYIGYDGAIKNKADFHWFTTNQEAAKSFATEQLAKARGDIQKSFLTAIETRKVNLLDFTKMSLSDEVRFTRSLYDFGIRDLMHNQGKLPLLSVNETITARQLKKYLGYKPIGKLLNSGQHYSDGAAGVMFKKWMKSNGFDGYRFKNFKFDEIALNDLDDFILKWRKGFK